MSQNNGRLALPSLQMTFTGVNTLPVGSQTPQLPGKSNPDNNSFV
jgi:hypothetical protein